MKTFYGSLSNRLDENKYYNDTYNNLRVGDYATIYSYSDRHAYEVVEVKDQLHIKIRRLKTVRVDKNGMSEDQEYLYISDKSLPVLELERNKNGKWREVFRYTLDLYNKLKEERGFVLWPEDVIQGVLKGKDVKRSREVNISFGIADEYFDYSF